MKNLKLISLIAIFTTIFIARNFLAPKDSNVVVIYSTRHYEADDILLQEFTKQTGITVKTLKGGADELIERIAREGELTEADLLITVDAGRLHRARERGLLQPVESEELKRSIPSNYRDQNGYWFGLTKRARVIAYDRERTDPEEFSTYEALTEDQWKNRLIIRSSENIYNISLLASLVEVLGEDGAKEWASGIVANMAREPRGNDRDQAKAVIAGEGDAALINTYYIGRMHNSSDPHEVEVARRIGLFFPNQETSGTHVNISGAALTAHSKNRENAIKLLHFLAGKEAQTMFAEINYEFPVNPEASPSELVASWGEFKAQDINLSALGVHNNRAAHIFDEVSWR